MIGLDSAQGNLQGSVEWLVDGGCALQVAKLSPDNYLLSVTIMSRVTRRDFLVTPSRVTASRVPATFFPSTGRSVPRSVASYLIPPPQELQHVDCHY